MSDKTTAAARRPSQRPVMRGDELFRRHHGRLLRLVARDTGAPPVLAEDACAFAWLQLLRHQPERQRIVGWLRVVARQGASAAAPEWGTRPLDEPTREAWDRQTGESLTLAERIPAPVGVELAVEARGAARTGRSSLAPPPRARAEAGGLQLPARS